MIDRRFSSGLNQGVIDDCTLIIDFLEQYMTVSKDSLPTYRDMFDKKDELFAGTDKSPTFEAFRAKIKDRFNKIVNNPDLFDVGLYSWDGANKSYLSQSSGGHEKSAKALRFGIDSALNKAKIPELIGQQALATLTCFLSIQQDVCMPSISDLPEIIDTLEDYFGILDVERGVGNPYFSARRGTDRKPAEFLLFRPDGRSKARGIESDDASDAKRKTWYQSYFETALNCFLRKDMMKINYRSASGGNRWSVFDPIICTVLVKNGAVYLIGVIWNEATGSYLLNKDGTFYQIQTYKMDRIRECIPANIRSRLTNEDVTRISSQVTTNDGAYFVPPEKRIDAVIKVSPRYSYYEEAIPFLSESAAERLPPEKLEALGQPPDARCYLIKQTNIEHLTNEVAKARGNIVVVAPSDVVREVCQDLAILLGCQSECEPKGVANVPLAGYVRYPNADSHYRVRPVPDSIPTEN